MTTKIQDLLNTLSSYHDSQQPFNPTSPLEVFSWFKHTSEQVQNRFYEHHSSSFVMDIYHRWVEQSWKERKHLEDAFDGFDGQRTIDPQLLEQVSSLPVKMLQCARSLQLWRSQSTQMLAELEACEKGFFLCTQIPQSPEDLVDQAATETAVVVAMIHALQEEMDVLGSIIPGMERDAAWVNDHLTRVWRQWSEDRALQDHAMALQGYIATIDQAQEIICPVEAQRTVGVRRAA